MTFTVAPHGPVLRFMRSVRLEADAVDGASLDGYVVTPQARVILRRILGSLRPEGTERAITLTGPYGTGKSAFALFLLQLVRDPQGEAFELLRRVDGPLAKELSETLPKPLLPVPLTLRRARLSVLLLEGLENAATALGHKKLVRDIKGLLSETEEAVDSRLVLQVVSDVKTQALQAGYGGLIIIFDELGKGLEYEARYGSDDIYLLQELAEVAVRSGPEPLLFVGVLHQGFEQYGEHLLSSSRKEWGKVQGRFADIAFLEPPEQQMRLAARATQALEPVPPVTLRERGKAAAQALTELSESPVPKTISPLEFVGLADEGAPLHPITLVAL